ncbi:hypothetical protein BHM03_00033648 [Ensete ventricosum]|nr:hypothetical protein BHM03_00033648 [Ensete ventricosum]
MENATLVIHPFAVRTPISFRGVVVCSRRCNRTTIRHMMEDDCFENAVHVPNMTSRILPMVIEYCRKHVDVDQATLFHLVLVGYDR